MATKTTAKNTEVDVKGMIDTLVANSQEALAEFMKLDQAQTDKIAHAMALAGVDAHIKLSLMAHEETGRGVYEDKVIKNIFATEYIWNSIKDVKSVGVVAESELEGFVEVAEPVGVVACVTPVTNPTSTTMFKAIICAKARNPVIFGFHPSAQKCSLEAAKILRDAAIKAGAPKNCIQWVEYPSVEATGELMNHPGVSMILATGGPGMVKAAYSSGKPALGVGAGNTPCYIEKSAKLERACTDLILSKTFDNGMICASEQAVIVDKEIQKPFEAFMKDNDCYFLNEKEIELVTKYAINLEKMALNPDIVGKPAAWIAEQAGVKVPANTKILIAKLKDVSLDYPLSKEKLSPILAYFVVNSTEEGLDKSDKMLKLGGLGHTAVIHSTNDDVIRAFGHKMQAGRVVANSPASQGAIGDIYNTSTPSLTLGCGSYGRNSTTSNVSTVNLINRKRVAMRRNNMQWFKIPPKIYFEENSVQYLEKMEGITKAFIVTDPTMVQLGYVDKVLHYLRKRVDYCHSEIYSDVEPDPDVETVMRGVAAMNSFKPDVIISLGGGSAIDAAKGMWLFYEHPDTNFDDLRQKFLDIRKRTANFPKLGEKAKFVAIPTTSGTGSEVTSFSVITDKSGPVEMKYPLADYALTPDVAIIDPQFVKTMPRSIVADTGMDVLTHAIEAYVSIMASDFTDGLALQAIDLVYNNLLDSYNADGTNNMPREKMHNASCIAGMAFTNAFLGLNHSMAHKLGGEFHIPHGRANAVLMPYIIKFNATKPKKFVAFPKYEKFIADEKYAKIAGFLGLGGKTTEESVNNLINAILKMMKDLGIPTSIKDCGVSEKDFNAKLDELSLNAHSDQCTTANPTYPLVDDIKAIYRAAFEGEDPTK